MRFAFGDALNLRRVNAVELLLVVFLLRLDAFGIERDGHYRPLSIEDG